MWTPRYPRLVRAKICLSALYGAVNAHVTHTRNVRFAFMQIEMAIHIAACTRAVHQSPSKELAEKAVPAI